MCLPLLIEIMFALVDCNNFYASCERAFNPALAKRPVVVLSNNDGCVIARSNEAKALGIRMAEPAFHIEEFLEKNNVAVLSSNYALYGDMSERVMNTIASMVKDVEVYSIDEIFLDLSGYEYFDLLKLGQNIRKTVKAHTGIPVSVGIASTKTLAKLANKIAKKGNGVFILTTDDEVVNVLSTFPVEDIWGIGRQHSQTLQKYGIKTALQLRNANENWVRKNFTVVGLRTMQELKGISCIPLEDAPPPKKNICTARSFGKMTNDIAVVKEAVANYATRCAEKLRKEKSCTNLISVFLESNRFRDDLPQYNNCKVMHLPVASNYTPEIVHYAIMGLELIFKSGYLYKKAGVIVSGIVSENQVQGSIFDYHDRNKNKRLMSTVDTVNKSYGRDTLRVAAQGFDRKWKLRQERLSPCYTTRWSDLLTIEL
jgi:DNA polymerase V